jgi:hypothetical protein
VGGPGQDLVTNINNSHLTIYLNRPSRENFAPFVGVARARESQ